jgi:hypothetical protein
VGAPWVCGGLRQPRVFCRRGAAAPLASSCQSRGPVASRPASARKW